MKCRVRRLDVVFADAGHRHHELLAAVRWSIRKHDGDPSSRHVDELLDERNELNGN